MVPRFEIDVREKIRPVRIGSSQDDSNRMADRLDQRAEHDRHVIAIAGLQLQHPPGRMEDLDPEGIFRITHVALHPPEQRIDLAQVVFSGDTALDQDVDRLLADVEVARALADQASDVRRRGPGAFETARDAPPIDARRLGTWRRISIHARVTARRPPSRAGALVPGRNLR